MTPRPPNDDHIYDDLAALRERVDTLSLSVSVLKTEARLLRWLAAVAATALIGGRVSAWFDALYPPMPEQQPDVHERLEKGR
ncbi:MAG: hypothetical protein AAFX78_19850 [Cyanobacteria bacterium J06638_20]